MQLGVLGIDDEYCVLAIFTFLINWYIDAMHTSIYYGIKSQDSVKITTELQQSTNNNQQRVWFDSLTHVAAGQHASL